MNAVVRLQMEMVIRVRDLLRAHPFGEPKADQVVLRFDDTVSRAIGLAVEQGHGSASAKGARTLRDSLQATIRRDHLRFLSTVARAASRENPELAAEFKIPAGRLNQQEFRQLAQRFADQAKEHDILFREYGLTETGLADLTALLEGYDRATAEANAGRRSHTGARRELAKTASDLVRQVKLLDVLMGRQIRRDPKLAGAWASARNVAWPLSRDGESPAAEGKKGVA